MRRILTITLSALSIALIACSNQSHNATPDDGNDSVFRDWFRDADARAMNERAGRHVNAAVSAVRAGDLPAVATQASQAADEFDQLAAHAIDFDGYLASLAYQAWTSCASAQRLRSQSAERGIQEGSPQAMQFERAEDACSADMDDFQDELHIYEAGLPNA